MKTLYVFTNLVLAVIVGYVVLQLIPQLISADSTEKVLAGVGLIILGFAFSWTRGIEVFNNIKKVEDNNE